MNNISLKEKVKIDIKDMVDDKYKNFHSNLCPGTENIMGVRIPILRDYAKNLNKEYTLEQILSEVEDEYYEETMLKGISIGLNKNEDIEKILKYVEGFIPAINNWAVCDVFCGGLKITNKNKERVWNFLKKYLQSDKEFEIRFGLVMILGYYIDEEYLSRDFEIFDSITNEGYYVKMAKAWAISIALVKYYDQTLKYLKNTNMDKWTYNKVIQKALESYRITDYQKQYLRELKIK